MADEFVIHCPNCGLIFRPDPAIYKDGDRRCPRCGADFDQPNPKLRSGDYGQEHDS